MPFRERRWVQAALVLLACDLVRINGKSTKTVHFPVAANAGELPESNQKEEHAPRRAGRRESPPDLLG